MPEYIIYYQESKKEIGKPKTETVFSPCITDAWRDARSLLPKRAKIIDVVREGEPPSKPE
jgi:hypothetical protein